MRDILYILTALMILSGCGPGTSTENNQATQRSIDSLEAVQDEPLRTTSDTVNFATAFRQFFSALQASDTAALNNFIHPEYGLWVIEQPGAVPKMTFVTDISNFKRTYQNRSFFSIREEVKACNLQQETWPAFSCADMNYEAGKSGYSKDGCFIAGPEKFVKSGYWNYADLPLTEIKRIQTTLPRVQRSVLHTGTSFEFHFGYIDNHWRLLFAKLIHPCSA